RGGDLASAYLRYLHPKGNAEMRLGRFFFAEGTAAEILDGIYLKARTRAGFAEIGVTYLKEKGDFQGDDRESVGGDLWIRPGIPVELTGRATYNVSTSSLSSQRYVLRITPYTRLDSGWESRG